MTKLEEKLAELGYELKDYYYYRFFQKIIVEDNISIKIKTLGNTMKSCYVDTSLTFQIKFQQDIDNLQQAFNVLQQDLEVLKEYA